MGPNERAWRVAGLATIIDPALDRPDVIAVAGETVIACVPEAWARQPQLRDAAFAAATMQLVRDRIGWLGQVRRLGFYTAREADRRAS